MNFITLCAESQFRDAEKCGISHSVLNNSPEDCSDVIGDKYEKADKNEELKRSNTEKYFVALKQESASTAPVPVREEFVAGP